jgi:hypothetical protein
VYLHRQKGIEMKKFIAMLLMASVVVFGSFAAVGCGDTTPKDTKKDTKKDTEKKDTAKKDTEKKG